MMALNWLSYKFLPFDGYGRFSMALAQAMYRLGYDVHPGLIESVTWPGWMVRQTGLDFSMLTIGVMPPHELRTIPGRMWNFSMYEETGLPKGWATILNETVERVLVPCNWTASVYINNGVKRPINVVPGGVDPEEFPLLARPPRSDRYTFMALGDRGKRKGWDIVMRAFYEAFTPADNAVLVIKQRAVEQNVRMDNAESEDDFSRARYIVWRADVEHMRDVYIHADCFVYPSRGDGWAMPPREAACMGVPTIALRWSGTEVGIDNWAVRVLEKYTLVPSSLLGGGKWAEPDVHEVAEAMRWCYDHRQLAYETARLCADWLRREQTWAHSAKALESVLEEWG